MTISLADRPLLTRVYAHAEDFVPEGGSVYIFARSHEPRSHTIHTSPDVRPVQIAAYTTSDFVVVGEPEPLRLRSRQDLDAFWQGVGGVCYLDITGLPHHVWVPLLLTGIRANLDIRVTYVEPRDYVFSSAPTEGTIFDLSDEILGLAPLPGLTSLIESSAPDESVFVALLGFEGTRFAYMVEQVQPAAERIIPVIGVPGFRPEYPFYSYMGNRSPLLATGAWSRARFCIANCPFSLFYLLEDIAEEYPEGQIQIAVVGTKPHSVGAVVFAAAFPNRTELIYDYPVRSPRRTIGSQRQLVYHVSALPQLGLI